MVLPGTVAGEEEGQEGRGTGWGPPGGLQGFGSMEVGWGGSEKLGKPLVEG